MSNAPKVTFTDAEDTVHTVTVEAAGEVATVAIDCPACRAKGPTRLGGTGMSIGPDDRHYVADAVALCCKRKVGVLRAYPSTLFGLREDEAVLVRGRARVY
jgi:hypothetical protein